MFLSCLTTISVFYRQGKCNILDLIVIRSLCSSLSLSLQILRTSHTDILPVFPVLQGPCIRKQVCPDLSTLVKFLFNCQFKLICLREVSP